MSLLTDGTTLAHYTVLEELGRGGMGVVYKAKDQRLDRMVAVKVLPPDRVADADRKRRFIQEAKAASALNHPNIVTIYDIGSAAGNDFIAMELVEGTTLRETIAGKGLSSTQAVSYGLQITDALAAAHAKGIVHRDLKPGNVMVTPNQLVKVLDFGLAKLTETSSGEEALTASMHTDVGMILGTAAYMSPEQAEGKKTDARSDIFSFGALLYEMVTGVRAFQGESTLSILSSILRDEPKPVKSIAPHTPAKLVEIITHCLRKEPGGRFQSMDEVKTQLQALKANSLVGSDRAVTRQPAVRIAVAVLALVVIGFAGRYWQQNRNTARAYGEMMPEIRRLIGEDKLQAAFVVVEEAMKYIPRDRDLVQIRQGISVEAPVATDPPGAIAGYRPYGAPETAWRDIGSTPVTARIPTEWLEWRFSKPGYRETSRILYEANQTVKLAKAEDVPAGMVYVPAATWNVPLQGMQRITGIPVGEFYLDKFETTNQQFKQFVDQGGYRRGELWRRPFVEDRRTLSFEQAMEHFRDKTGRPGPATWELGEYPAGQADYPVTGVSWYEAAAYAEFAGKSLPPIAYWSRAARPSATGALVVPLSNFSGAPAAVGKHSGMNDFGAYDMAGNAKEWCWNEAGGTGGKRYILGGAWNDPVYLFNDPDAQSPWARASTYGFRLMKRIGDEPLPESVTDPVVQFSRDYHQAQPVPDETFRLYSRLYAYDKTPLNPVVESTREEQYWKKQKVVYNAAYNNERILAYLFLPKNVSPPFQTILYFPGNGAQQAKTSENLEDVFAVRILTRSGRAVLFPVYKGTYERGGGSILSPSDTAAYRERKRQWYQDVARSLDYLETRDDIDKDKLGYYGASGGAALGAFFPAMEKRLKVSVLALAGLTRAAVSPEADSVNFAPHVTIPTLMLGGRYDFTFPLETSQLPMFRLLGTPEKDKRHVLFDTGHTISPNEFTREALDWLDRYLGPVK